jgi:hypothetical protein
MVLGESKAGIPVVSAQDDFPHFPALNRIIKHRVRIALNGDNEEVRARHLCHTSNALIALVIVIIVPFEVLEGYRSAAIDVDEGEVGGTR